MKMGHAASVRLGRLGEGDEFVDFVVVQFQSSRPLGTDQRKFDAARKFHSWRIKLGLHSSQDEFPH